MKLYFTKNTGKNEISNRDCKMFSCDNKMYFQSNLKLDIKAF